MMASEVALAFVDRINSHDVDAIAALMTEDHVFVDGLDNRIQGREAMRNAWRRYFAMVPDYRVEVERTLEAGDVVAMFGRAGGTYAIGPALDPGNRWEVPAAWLAVIRDQEVASWRVYADNQPIREIIARGRTEATGG